jgi:glucokinase
MPADAPDKYIGVDVGGTNIVTAIVTRDGAVLARWKQDTRRGAPKEELSAQIAEAVEAVLREGQLSIADIQGIGIGVPGVVDADAGHIAVLPNLNIRDVPLRDEMTARFPVPVAVGNDVNLGTLAEKWTGAARDVQSVVGVFVGTGIGGGVVIDGRLRTGASEVAGEIGHMIVQLDGPLCGCGNHGCWEALASRTAIERDIRLAVESGEATSLCPSGECPRVIKSSTLKRALAEGDPLTVRILSRAAEVLGYGAMTIRHLIDPEMILFGGGVIEACGDFMLPIIRDVVAGDKLDVARDNLRIERSEKGDDAVFLGAVALLLGQLGTTPAAGQVSVDPPTPKRVDNQAEAKVGYPEVTGLRFGTVKIDGEKFETDVVVFADGHFAKRKKKAVKRKYGTSHVIDAEELARVLQPMPDELIVGTGMQDSARLSPDAEEYLSSSGIKWTALPSPDAVDAYNLSNARRALLLHVTC